MSVGSVIQLDINYILSARTVVFNNAGSSPRFPLWRAVVCSTEWAL